MIIAVRQDILLKVISETIKVKINVQIWILAIDSYLLRQVQEKMLGREQETMLDTLWIWN